MPKIYEYIGYIFFFYSNDHPPVHFHVMKGERLMKVELTYVDETLFVKFFKIKKTPSFSLSQQKEIEIFVRKYHVYIVNKWNDFFEKGKKPNFKIIKDKIS